MGKIFSKRNSSTSSSSSKNNRSSYKTANEGEMFRRSQSNILQQQQAAVSINDDQKLRLIHSFDEYENVLYVNKAQNDMCVFGDEQAVLTLLDFNKKKEIKKWKGHEKDITKVVYCQRLNSYLSSSRDMSIKLWNLNSSQCQLNMINGHTLVINGIDVNFENTFVVSGSRDNNLNLWDLQTGKLLLTSHISRNLVTDLHWSSDGKLLIQSSEDKEIRIWDPMSLKLIFSFPKKQYIQASCYFSDDGNSAISSSNGFQGNGCEITLWDLRKRAMIHEFTGHSQTVTCAKFIQSSKLIASCSNDSTVRLWDVGTLKQVESLHVGGTLTSISEMNNGSLITSSLTNGIHIIDKPNVV